MLQPYFEKDEHIVTTQRKHWTFIAFRLAVIALMAAAPLVVGAIAAAIPEVPITNRGLIAFLGAYSLWLLFLFIGAFYSWTVWILDIWIVTDRKFVDIEQKSLFHRQVSTLTLEKVQDVTVQVDGVFATWLDFGTVIVQTAGQEREFVIHGIRRPYKFKEVLLCSCQELAQKNHEHVDGVTE